MSKTSQLFNHSPLLNIKILKINYHPQVPITLEVPTSIKILESQIKGMDLFFANKSSN